jgi:hypothetical protein
LLAHSRTVAIGSCSAEFFDGRRYLAMVAVKRRSGALLFSRRAESGRIAKRQPIFADAGFSLDLANLYGVIERPRDLLPQCEVALAVGPSKCLPAGAASSCGAMASAVPRSPQVIFGNVWHSISLCHRIFPLSAHRPAIRRTMAQAEHAAHDPSDFVYDSTGKYLTLENVGGHLRRMYRGIAATPIGP